MKNKDRRGGLTLRRLFLYMLILFLTIFCFSCKIEPYYILNDPYILSEKQGSCSFKIFLLKQSIHLGRPVEYITLNNRDDIALFISEYKNNGFSQKPVVSPLVFVEGKELFHQENINPVVYNFREEKIPNKSIAVVESNRNQAFYLAGTAAADVLHDGESLFLFFSLETSQRQEEYNSFIEGFSQSKGKESLIEVKITSPLMRRLGDIDQYETFIRGRAIGLYGFFSGSFNTELIDRFIINDNSKYITEDYKDSYYKKENYVGSVEDDLPGLIKEGLNIASGRSNNQTVFHPAIFRHPKK